MSGGRVASAWAISAPALIFAAALASLAYLSIIYAFSVALQHIGKGICVILVFAQIPGATGLYPIEMTSPFFQSIYPLFPFHLRHRGHAPRGHLRRLRRPVLHVSETCSCSRCSSCCSWRSGSSSARSWRT
ncbi:MAG: hypothetical protein ACLTDR_06300 [Adlercreutzia equolifaciens]